MLNALGNVVTALTHGEFSFESLAAQLITIAVVSFVTAIWGRFFYGYLCSFGSLQELFFWIFKKFPHKRITVPTKIDRVLQYIKYVVVAFIAVALWITAIPMDASLSPWGIFGMLTSGNLSVMSAAIFTGGFVLLLVFFIGSVFIERFFL